MNTFANQTRGVRVSFEYPEGWHTDTTPVTSLVVPRQLLAASNRPIRITPKSTDRSRPDLTSLDRRGILLWGYLQLPNDPEPFDGSLPEYASSGAAMRYDGAEALPGFEARDWSPSDFLWKRIGRRLGDLAFTLWIWEGAQAIPSDIATARGIVNSLRIRRMAA